MTPNDARLAKASADRGAAPSRALFALAALYLVFAATQPARGWVDFPTCAFRAITYLPCPGCGLTRSLTALLHGNPVAAWHWNPLGFVALPLLVAASVLATVRTPWLRAVEGRTRTRGFTLAVVLSCAAVSIFGIVRIALVASGLSSFPD